MPQKDHIPRYVENKMWSQRDQAQDDSLYSHLKPRRGHDHPAGKAYTIEELKEMIFGGTIEDSKTIAAILAYESKYLKQK